MAQGPDVYRLAYDVKSLADCTVCIALRCVFCYSLSPLRTRFQMLCLLLRSLTFCYISGAIMFRSLVWESDAFLAGATYEIVYAFDFTAVSWIM
jgi:hypothetical protein